MSHNLESHETSSPQQGCILPIVHYRKAEDNVEHSDHLCGPNIGAHHSLVENSLPNEQTQVHGCRTSSKRVLYKAKTPTRVMPQRAARIRTEERLARSRQSHSIRKPRSVSLRGSTNRRQASQASMSHRPRGITIPEILLLRRRMAQHQLAIRYIQHILNTYRNQLRLEHGHGNDQRSVSYSQSLLSQQQQYDQFLQQYRSAQHLSSSHAQLPLQNHVQAPTMYNSSHPGMPYSTATQTHLATEASYETPWYSVGAPSTEPIQTAESSDDMGVPLDVPQFLTQVNLPGAFQDLTIQSSGVNWPAPTVAETVYNPPPPHTMTHNNMTWNNSLACGDFASTAPMAINNDVSQTHF